MILDKISKFIVKNKYIILLVVGIILAVSIVGTIFLVEDSSKINSDMMSYMDEDFTTSKGYAFFKENFNLEADSMIVVKGTDKDPFINEAIKNIRKKDGVRQLIWAEDAYSLVEIEDQFNDLDFGDFSNLTEEQREEVERIFSSYIDDYEGTDTIDNILNGMATIDDFVGLLQKLMKADSLGVSTDSLVNYLRKPAEKVGEYYFIIMVMVDLPASSEEASILHEEIKAEFSGREIASSGTIENSKSVLDDITGDLPSYLLFAVLAVIVILLLTTKSFVEVFILVFSLGVSIVISMGVNYLYPNISIISFAASAILQLAVTMDYAIFYMHTYRKYRENLTTIDATQKAIPEVTTSILASALTTIGGFASLYLMRFRIGTDIANVLIKGIALSFLTVITLQPILTMLLDKVIVKTSLDFGGAINNVIRKKKPNSQGIKKGSIIKPVARFSVFARIILVVLAVALIAPSIIAQNKIDMSYFLMKEQKEVRSQEQIIADELGNQMIMAVPLKIKNGEHQDFIDELLADPNGKVEGVISAFTTIKGIDGGMVSALLTIMKKPELIDLAFSYIAEHSEDINYELDKLGISLDSVDSEAIVESLKNIDEETLSSYFSLVPVGKNGKDNEWYTLYTIAISGSTEDETASKTYQYIDNLCSKYFGKNKVYSIGYLTASYDMKITAPNDFITVTWVSALIIFIIIAVLLKNPLKSGILVLLIELGIWINLALTFLLGEQLNFIVYVIISSIQLGCTVDYAILLANTFEKNRKTSNTSKECAINSIVECLPAILTSSLIISIVCFVVNIISHNLVIKQLTGMLGRGALISLVLVVFVQTAIMSFYNINKKHSKSFESKLKDIEKQISVSEQEEKAIIKSNSNKK